MRRREATVRRPSRGIALALLILGLSLTSAAWAGDTGPTPVPGLPPRLTAGRAPATPLDLPYQLHLPLVFGGPAGTVDVRSRQSSLVFFQQEYQFAPVPPINWTGSHAACDPGTTDAAFRQAILRRINYFRAMAGVPAHVTFSDVYNAKAQAAALMMSVNGALSHSPPASWTCYSADGAQGAGNSNLYLGVYGWDAITGYVRDPGSNNTAVGHRRWILYPQTQQMGTGDVPPASGHWASNALWVFDTHLWEPRPPVRDDFVAWPPAGYVPYQVVFARWSFSFPGADFNAATVSLQSGGAPIPVAQSGPTNGYGENTLVWIPMGLPDGANWPRPVTDTTYVVTIHNVTVNSQSRDFSYSVTVFDPQ